MQIRIIIFNIFIGFVLLAIVLFPLLFLGMELTAEFMRALWPMLLVLLLSLAVMNGLFFANKRLLTLLGQEDWPALTAYLERKIYEEGRYSSRFIRLLVQSYLILGNYAGIMRLKDTLAAMKPVLLVDNALIFGAACLLHRDTVSAVAFFEAALRNGRHHGSRVEWLRWYYGFSLNRMGSVSQAAAIFTELVAKARQMSVVALAAFFLFPLSDAGRSAAEEGRSRVRAAIKTARHWRKLTARIQTEVHGVIISTYLDEAGAWIFEGTYHETHS